MAKPGLCNDIVTWVQDACRSRGLNESDTDVIVAEVQDRIMKYWDGGLEQIIGPGGIRAHKYVRTMTKHAIFTYREKQKRQAEVENEAAASRKGTSLPARPGVLRQTQAFPSPDTSELAIRHMLYDRARPHPPTARAITGPSTPASPLLARGPFSQRIFTLMR